MQDLSEVEKEWIKLGIEKNYEKDTAVDHLICDSDGGLGM